MNVLGIGDFFYVNDHSYDFLAEKSLPSYHEAHGILVAALCMERDAEFDVIDLGVGSGVTSAYILKNFPNARVTGVDLFDEMLADARVRLAPFSNRVELVQSDNTKFLKRYPGKVQVIVSAFCIHHLDEEGKKELFQFVHDKLLSGGRFLMLDLTTFDDPYIMELARNATITHMKANVEDEKYRKQWIHHWNEVNTPHSVDRMVGWLDDIGLNTEVVFRNYEIALISALER